MDEVIRILFENTSGKRKTKMIKLEYFTKYDYKQLIDWSGDEAFLLQWAGPEFKYPLTAEQLNKYTEGSNSIHTSEKLVFKAIEEQTGTVIGHICLARIDRDNKSARIGKVLVGKSLERGNGYGQEMIKAVLHIGFEQLGLHRISLGVFDFNLSAIKCYEKSGFFREGLLRDSSRYRDTYWNLIEMSMLDDDWRRVSQKRNP
jgi:RimJ/RimL family protein N-acetyltransferase